MKELLLHLFSRDQISFIFTYLLNSSGETG
jgi:hypothetical protein